MQILGTNGLQFCGTSGEFSFLTAQVVFENGNVILDKHLYIAKSRKSLILCSHPFSSVSLS